MIELESPQIEPVEEAGTYAKYEAGPLQAGYGVTLGNALRRVLLSSRTGPEALPIGVIAVDAIFTPVRKINYWVESMRVGQMTNYDKLTIEIETDGTISPEEALSRSADILVNQFRPFVTIGMASAAPAAATG